MSTCAGLLDVLMPVQWQLDDDVGGGVDETMMRMSEMMVAKATVVDFVVASSFVVFVASS